MKTYRYIRYLTSKEIWNLRNRIACKRYLYEENQRPNPSASHLCGLPGELLQWGLAAVPPCRPQPTRGTRNRSHSCGQPASRTKAKTPLRFLPQFLLHLHASQRACCQRARRDQAAEVPHLRDAVQRSDCAARPRRGQAFEQEAALRHLREEFFGGEAGFIQICTVFYYELSPGSGRSFPTSCPDRDGAYVPYPCQRSYARSTFTVPVPGTVPGLKYSITLSAADSDTPLTVSFCRVLLYILIGLTIPVLNNSFFSTWQIIERKWVFTKIRRALCGVFSVA